MRRVERTQPWTARRSADHSSTCCGVHCHGIASACRVKARTVRSWSSTYPGERFRASCWLRQPLTIASKTCSSGRSSGRPSIRCSRADPGTSPFPPIRHHSPSIASGARISHQMRLGGVFAVQSLDGVSPADARRQDGYRTSEANVPGGTAPYGPGPASRTGVAYSRPMQLAAVRISERKIAVGVR